MFYSVSVFGYHVESAQHIKRIINAPLHVFEVHVYLFQLVYFQNAVGNQSSCRHILVSNFFQYFTGQEHQLLALR